MHDAEQMQLHAARLAERLQMARTSLSRVPSKDADGHPTIGWGRRMLTSPLTDAEAANLCRSQVSTCRTQLHSRVLELQAVNPTLGTPRLAVLYSLALTLGVEKIVEWQPLWEALKRANYRQAMREVVRANLEQLRGKSDQVVDHIGELCEVLLSGLPPELNA